MTIKSSGSLNTTEIVAEWGGSQRARANGFRCPYADSERHGIAFSRFFSSHCRPLGLCRLALLSVWSTVGD